MKHRPISIFSCWLAIAHLLALGCAEQGHLAKNHSHVVSDRSEYAIRYEYIGTVEGKANIVGSSSVFSTDGELFITSGHDRVRVWHTKTLLPATDWIEHSNLVNWYLSPSGRKVLTSSADKTIHVISVPTGQIELNTPPYEDSLIDVSLNMSEDKLLAKYKSSYAIISLINGKILFEKNEGFAIVSVTLDPSGRHFCALEQTMGFHLLDFATEKELLPIFPYEDLSISPPMFAKFDKKGDRLLLPKPVGYMLVEVPSGRKISEAESNSPDCNWETRSLAVSDDGNTVGVLTGSGSVAGPARVYDSASGSLRSVIGTHVYSGQLSSDGALLLTYDATKGSSELWSTRTGRLLQSFEGSNASATSDFSIIVLNNGSSTANVWKRI